MRWFGFIACLLSGLTYIAMFASIYSLPMISDYRDQQFLKAISENVDNKYIIYCTIQCMNSILFVAGLCSTPTLMKKSDESGILFSTLLTGTGFLIRVIVLSRLYSPSIAKQAFESGQPLIYADQHGVLCVLGAGFGMILLNLLGLSSLDVGWTLPLTIVGAIAGTSSVAIFITQTVLFDTHLTSMALKFSICYPIWMFMLAYRMATYSTDSKVKLT